MITETEEKAAKFDECVDILSIVKTSANPHDVLKAYDEIGEILKPYIFKDKEASD